MILIIGAGTVGRAVAADLSRDWEVAVSDISSSSLKGLKDVTKFHGDIFDRPELIRKAEVIVTSLPGSISFGVVRRLLRMGRSVVDTGFMPEDPLLLDNTAASHGAIYVPDAGYAPGLSNVFAGHLFRTMEPDTIEIFVAGLAKSDTSPLHHIVTFNVEGWIDEYLRPAQIVRNGRQISVDPLGEFKKVDFPGAGRFEGFYSDGLRTLLSTVRVRNMHEITLRYPGHLELMKAMREIGFLSERKIDGCTPRSISEELFSRIGGHSDDMCLTMIRGRKAGRSVEFVSVDSGDSSSGITSMGRMTGYSAAAFTRLILEGDIAGSGAFPPEYAGFDEGIFRKTLFMLRKRGIVFRRRTRNV
jgi:lysine 6-dehydrogenase